MTHMVKKLTKSGNSYALVIERPILDLLNITPDTPLNVTTNGQGIQITPVRDQITDEEVRAAYRWAEQKYGRMMKRLAE